MKFKSQVFTQVSGSVGGLTFSHNKGGLYTRARTIPTDPASSFQLVVRNNLTNAVSRWESLLTQAERDAWQVYADNVTVLDSLGDPMNLDALAMFIRTQVPNLQSGLPFITNAPTVFNLGDMGIVTFTAGAALNAYSVSFDNTQEWANVDDGALLIYGGRPQNVTINFFKGPYRFAAKIDGDGTTPPTSPQVVNSPFALTQGQRVWIKAQGIDPDGRMSTPQVIGPVVVGA